MQKEIKQSWFFNQAPQEVWEYLTKPELIEQWLMQTDFKPIMGHKFRFTHAAKNEGPYEGFTLCEVLEVKPFTRLSYTWKGNKKDKSSGYDSIVVWTLVPKNNGTELQLVHDGFTALEDVIAHTQGWNKCISLMTDLLNFSSNRGANA